MNKKEIIHSLIEQLKKEHELYERISDKARKDAIDSEMKQEGKYDTRAIEAGYLAGAQQRRFEEIKLDIQNLETLNPKNFTNSKVALGSLVQLDDGTWYFIAPVAGGATVQIQNQNIKILSLKSPLARNLIGLDEGESFILENSQGSKDYSIEKIL